MPVTLISFFVIVLSFANLASGAASPATEPSIRVPFVVLDEYSVSKIYQAKNATMFAVVGNGDAFSKMFISRISDPRNRTGKDTLESKAAVVAIRRDRAIWHFAVHDVTAEADGELRIRYTAASTPSDSITVSSLILSMPREIGHDKVIFEENGKVVGEANEEWQDEVADAWWQTRKTDLELNQVYQQLMGMLGPAEKKQLVAAERAWIAYRDAEGAFASQSQIGSGSTRSLYRAMCLRSLTEDRIKQLQIDVEDMSPK